jgi:hypothetical protein
MMGWNSHHRGGAKRSHHSELKRRRSARATRRPSDDERDRQFGVVRVARSRLKRPRQRHGRFRTQGVRIGEQVTYPFSQEVYLTKEGDSASYTYSFTKDTSTSEWRLTSAWRTLPDGKREELKVE